MPCNVKSIYIGLFGNYFNKFILDEYNQIRDKDDFIIITTN